MRHGAPHQATRRVRRRFSFAASLQWQAGRCAADAQTRSALLPAADTRQDRRGAT